MAMHVACCPTEFPVTNYHLVKQTRLQYYTIGHAKPSIRGFIILLLCNTKCPHVHFVRDNYSKSARLLDYHHVLVFHDIRRSRVHVHQPHVEIANQAEALTSNHEGS